MEIMIHAQTLNLRIAEVPITFVDRIYGASKMGTKEIIAYLGALWMLFTTT